jgi:hypothetical protein
MLSSKQIVMYKDFATGTGGRGETWTREKVRGQQFTKLGRNTNMTDYISSL